MKDDLIAAGGNAIAWTLTIADFKDITATISYIAAIITSILTALYIVYKWYKKATSEDSKGGKSITFEEIKDLKEEVEEHVKNREEDL